jgi:uncharacterized protein YbjT (DUF2867 family)
MIVITAPTGNIGHHVVQELLAAGEKLRLVLRDATKLPEGVRSQVEVVEGSHGDAAVVDRAFADADAVFWLAPPDATRTLEQAYVDFARPAATVIRRHGVKRVVSITALGRGTPWQDRAGLVTASIRMDDLLMQTGVAFRGLAMPSFMDNVVRQAGSIKQNGLFFSPIAPGMKAPTAATRDMGAVAARLLADGTWTGQAEVPVLGPEDLSFDDMMAIASDVLGRTVRYQHITLDALKAQMLSGGMSESFAQGYVDMMRAKDEGMDNAALRTPESSTPTSFRQWCEQVLKPAVLAT